MSPADLTKRVIRIFFIALLAWEFIVLGFGPNSALISPAMEYWIHGYIWVAYVYGTLTGHFVFPYRAWMPWPRFPQKIGLIVVFALLAVAVALDYWARLTLPGEVVVLASVLTGAYFWSQPEPKESAPGK